MVSTPGREPGAADARGRRPGARGGRQPARDAERAVLVCGLGRFGAATAWALTRLGYEVLAVDRRASLVQEWSSRLARVVEADSTSIEAMEQLEVRRYPIAVVGIGSSLEGSVLTASNLVDLEIPQIWAKAVSQAHGAILERIGVHRVVYPEADAGERVARVVSGRLLEYMPFDGGFAIVKMRPPLETQGFTLAESQVRRKYGVTVVGVKTPGQDFTYAVPDTRVSAHDVLIVSGHSELIEKFAARP